MVIKQKAIAGTLESNDIFVEIEPIAEGIEVNIQSIVFNQFAGHIEKTIKELLKEFDIAAVKVNVNDRGAIDCTIRARVETAVKRAGSEGKN